MFSFIDQMFPVIDFICLSSLISNYCLRENLVLFFNFITTTVLWNSILLNSGLCNFLLAVIAYSIHCTKALSVSKIAVVMDTGWQWGRKTTWKKVETKKDMLHCANSLHSLSTHTVTHMTMWAAHVALKCDFRCLAFGYILTTIMFNNIK